MGISATVIPLKRVRVSTLEYDTDIDTGTTYGIKTDNLSSSSDILNISNARLDGFLESRYFTTVNSGVNILYSVWPTPVTITNHNWCNPVPVFKIPAGMLNGSKFSIAASVRNVDGGTTHFGIWNITQDFYLVYGDTSSSTFVLIYTPELTVGPGYDVLPGDIIGVLYYTSGTSTGEVKDVIARGTKTVTFKEGTISWSL